MPAFFIEQKRRCVLIKRRNRFPSNKTRVNKLIRVPEVRLILSSGEQLGVKPTKEALEIAENEGLDLVEVAPSAKPPVARILDYSKYKYELEQKAKKARKHATIIEVKEIKMRPKIDVGDYNTKTKHIIRFLKAGAKVKVTIMFRGREMAHKELGRDILDRVVDDVAEYGFVESKPKQDGRNLIMVLASSGKKEEKKENAEKENT